MICTIIPTTSPHFSYTGFHIVGVAYNKVQISSWFEDTIPLSLQLFHCIHITLNNEPPSMWPESLSLYLCFTVTFYPTVVSLLIAEATAETKVVFHYSPNSSDTMELFFYLPSPCLLLSFCLLLLPLLVLLQF